MADGQNLWVVVGGLIIRGSSSEEASWLISASSKMSGAELAAPRSSSSKLFDKLPEELTNCVLRFLDVETFAVARQVCKQWNKLVSIDLQWRAKCLKKWKALDTDEHLWSLLCPDIPCESQVRWSMVYPLIEQKPQWTFRLQKTGRFICNIVARQVAGPALCGNGLPSILIVERRFKLLHLKTYVHPNSAMFYFEPEEESDRTGFNDFIQYLTCRARAGLALDDQRCFIFIPPVRFHRHSLEVRRRKSSWGRPESFPSASTIICCSSLRSSQSGSRRGFWPLSRRCN